MIKLGIHVLITLLIIMKVIVHVIGSIAGFTELGAVPVLAIHNTALETGCEKKKVVDPLL